MKLSHTILLIAAFSVAGLTAITIYVNKRVPTLVYIRTQELVLNYKGTIEAQQRVKSTLDLRAQLLDSLDGAFKQELGNYRDSYSRLGREERTTAENGLVQRESEIKRLKEEINNISAEEDEKYSRGVLNQINAFIETYSRQKGYDIVVGTTAGGNLLYGEKRYDATEEFIAEMNRHYETNRLALK